jgi:DNA-binding CsgD family transcriptional regulator
LERLAERAHASETPLAAGLLARSRALLAGSAEAEGLYQEAIEQLRQSTGTAQLARARLLYGEWLRRQRRRRDARQQLRTARDMFDAMGFEAFAQRSRGELLATGERASKRNGEVTEQLTPQEMQVARLVAEGSSNRQVGAQLFISPNTVEYHLQKVFRKLGVSSRTQLARSLLDRAGDNGAAPPATVGPQSWRTPSAASVATGMASSLPCGVCGAEPTVVGGRFRPILTDPSRTPVGIHARTGRSPLSPTKNIA